MPKTSTLVATSALSWLFRVLTVLTGGRFVDLNAVQVAKTWLPVRKVTFLIDLNCTVTSTWVDDDDPWDGTLGTRGEPVSERSKSITLWDFAIFSLRLDT